MAAVKDLQADGCYFSFVLQYALNLIHCLHLYYFVLWQICNYTIIILCKVVFNAEVIFSFLELQSCVSKSIPFPRRFDYSCSRPLQWSSVGRGCAMTDDHLLLAVVPIISLWSVRLSAWLTCQAIKRAHCIAWAYSDHWPDALETCVAPDTKPSSNAYSPPSFSCCFWAHISL